MINQQQSYRTGHMIKFDPFQQNYPLQDVYASKALLVNDIYGKVRRMPASSLQR